MLMTAGLGTRLRPFTDLAPKPLLPLMGIPMSQFALDMLAGAGVLNVVANVHHLAEQASAGLIKLERPSGMNLRVSDESAQLLGSSGGARKALPLLLEGGVDRPFFWVNGDVLCDVDLRALEMRHQRLRKQWGVKMTLTVFPAGPAGGKYREIDWDAQSGLMTALGDFAEARPFFASVAVVEPDAIRHLLDGKPSEFIPEVLLPALKEGKVGVFSASGKWFDIGSAQLWLDAHLALIEGLETGDLPALWRKRIERVNSRHGSMMWTSRDVSSARLPMMNWTGPGYWSPQGDASARAPLALGPSAVLYGNASESQYSGGIGFSGAWTQVLDLKNVYSAASRDVNPVSPMPRVQLGQGE